MRKWLIPVALGAAVVVAAPASAQTALPATQQAVAALRADHFAPGAGAVVRDGAQAHVLTTGTRALGQNLPFGPNHKFRVGSLSKSFTAAMVVQLAAEGAVDLDAPVETYLPGVVTGHYDGGAISVRQLLNHTSGIADYVPTAFDPLKHLDTYTLAEVAQWGLDQPPYFAPGAGHRYSGTNYLLAGMIIEAVEGRSYAESLTQRLTAPLGMTDTYLPEGTKALPAGHVRGYVGRFFYLDTTQMFEPSIGGSSGGLVSSGADASRFFQALMAGEVVPPAYLAEMTTPNGFPGSSDYGLGLFRLPLRCGGEAWGHNGIWPGYQSIAAATADGRSVFIGMNVLDALTSAPSGAPTRSTQDAAVTALCEVA